MATKTARDVSVADDYLKLVKRFPLVPIKSESHLTEAFKQIDELSVIDEAKLTKGQADYLMVLTDLVGKFEDEHHAVESTFEDGIDALKYLLIEHGMTASDLGRLLGSRQLGAAILRRERSLSKAHVLKMTEHFRVSADLLLREKPVKR